MAKLTVDAKTAIVLALLSLLFSAYVSYNHNDKQIEHRLTAVEQQQQNDSESIHRIDESVKQLVQWALGK